MSAMTLGAARPSAPWDRTTAIRVVAALVAVSLVVWLLPLVLPSYWIRIATSALILAVATASVALIFSQLGMISLGQQAVMGIGGWFALRVVHAAGVPFEIALLGGGVAGAIFGVLIGLPSLKTRGVYFALATLMIAAAFQVVISVIGFPDGGTGLLGRMHLGNRIVMPRPWLGQDEISYLRYCAVVAAICLLLVAVHTRTRAGRAWAQIRTGEAAAIVGGVNIAAFQIWAFALAGLLAGIAGGLMAGDLGVLDPSAFPASQSILLFAATIVGGAFHWFGPLLAGLLMRVVPGLLTDFGVNGNAATVLFGVALLHALITAPRGIAAQVAALAARIRRRMGPRSGQTR